MRKILIAMVGCAVLIAAVGAMAAPTSAQLGTPVSEDVAAQVYGGGCGTATYNTCTLGICGYWYYTITGSGPDKQDDSNCGCGGIINCTTSCWGGTVACGS